MKKLLRLSPIPVCANLRHTTVAQRIFMFCRRYGWGAVLLAFALFQVQAARLDLSSPASTDEWLVSLWVDENEPAEFTATAMAQSLDGYLWFGTFGGLVRFDGAKFTTLRPSDTPQLPSSGIVNLHLDRRGWMWISTYRGLVVRQGSEWRSFGTNDGWAGDYVRSFAERANGDLLLTTFDGRVLEFSQNKLAALPTPPGQDGRGYLGHADEAGQWWVAQKGFIGRWDGKRWLPLLPANAPNSEEVGCGKARDGGMWLLLDQELRKYRAGNEVSRVPLLKWPGGFWSLSEDSRGNVWICSYDRGLSRIAPDGRMQRWTTTNGLPADGVRFAFEDREQNLWMGMSGGGLARFKPRRVRTLATEPGYTTAVNSVCPDGKGGLWVGTYGRGLFRWTNAAATRLVSNGPTNALNYVQSVLQDKAGRLWLGVFENGLWLVENQTARRIPTEQTGGNNVIALFEDSRGRVWISGGGRTISVFDGRDFRRFAPDQSLVRGAVIGFAEDARGGIWFTDETGVFRLDQQRFIEVRTEEGQPVPHVACLKSAPDGSMWMGSGDRGLLRWREGRWATVDHHAGLPRAAIASMNEDLEGAWWLATDVGILRVSYAQLQAVAEGQARSVEWLALDRSDGLTSLRFAPDRQPATARDASGRLWFATGKGLAGFDPKDIRPNKVVADVHLEALVYRLPPNREASKPHDKGARTTDQVIRKSAPFATPPRLPAGSHRLEIHYTATCFSAPEKVRSQIKLEGHDPDWRDVAGARIAEFFELPPGTYTFRVRAANNDGVWNDAVTSLSFVLEPFFWQTWWFRLGLVALLVNTGGALAWWRSRAKHRQALAELERVGRQQAELAHTARLSTLGQLASTLAHELSQPLGAILRNAEAAEMLFDRKPLDEEEIRAILADIRRDDQRAGAVIDRMRALLKRRALEFERLSVSELLNDVMALTRAEAQSRQVNLRFNVAPDLHPVQGDRVHLQQVLLNLLMNGMDAMAEVPSGRRRLDVYARNSSGNTVEVAVSDSGPGIPTDKLGRVFEPFFTTKPHGMGVGLAICQTIISTHHGHISAENRPEGGAVFRFTLPTDGQGQPASALG